MREVELEDHTLHRCHVSGRWESSQLVTKEAKNLQQNASRRKSQTNEGAGWRGRHAPSLWALSRSAHCPTSSPTYTYSLVVTSTGHGAPPPAAAQMDMEARVSRRGFRSPTPPPTSSAVDEKEARLFTPQPPSVDPRRGARHCGPPLGARAPLS